MNDKSFRPFLIGFLVAAAVVLGYLYWQRQVRRMEAPGVLRLGTKPPGAPRETSADIAGAVASTVAEALAGTADVASNARAAAPRRRPMDDLTEIKGIGKTYAARLAAAGIRTFADLAGASPAYLLEVAQVREWQTADPADWIAQASARVANG